MPINNKINLLNIDFKIKDEEVLISNNLGKYKPIPIIFKISGKKNVDHTNSFIKILSKSKGFIPIKKICDTNILKNF